MCTTTALSMKTDCEEKWICSIDGCTSEVIFVDEKCHFEGEGGCTRFVKHCSLCERHWEQHKDQVIIRGRCSNHQAINPKLYQCSMKGCCTKVGVKGIRCSKHYSKLCSAEGCGRVARGGLFCTNHYSFKNDLQNKWGKQKINSEA